MEERRDFLIQGGMIALGLAGLATPGKAEAAGNTPRWAMIIDLNRCTGCQSCVIACKAKNQTPAGLFNTRIESNEAGSLPTVRTSYRPMLCQQCKEPACAKACRRKAITTLPSGIVVVDQARCQGDGACVAACPHRACFLNPARDNRMDKCDFCLTRLAKGLLPACVEGCPSGARLFGDAKAPQGEFGAYLTRNDLAPQPGRAGRVSYVPLRKNVMEKKS
ncbi:MAG: 4Fe-4S dicluster domain-containing protein [Desulfobulbaceae bacterium]|nr:4Fe-4S dicluster domain-containing protein [Desulfobulbaceae bacterium]